MKWIIQSNFLKDDNIGKLASFLDVHKIPWEQIQIVPFDDSEITEVSSDGITVFYGSVGLTHRVAKNNKWKPGVWFEPSKFSFQGILNGYKEHCLNADSLVLSLEEFVSLNGIKDDKVYFMRPVEDNKSITGACFTVKQIKELVDGLREADKTNRLQLGSVMQFASPKEIVKETRHFIVDGKVSTSSNYGHGKLLEEPSEDDISFAQKMVELYQPADVFTLDTCVLEDGTQKLVELNCFNSSGFYWADVHKLTKDITTFLKKKHG